MFARQCAKVFAAIAAVSVLAACASMPKSLPDLSEDARSSLGTVGVITAGPAVGGEVDGPVGVGNQAVVGVLKGGAIGTATGVGAGALLGLLCGPGAFVCSPIAAVGGGVLGLVGGGTWGGIARGKSAIPESTATEIQTALMNAISDRDLQADLRQRVVRHSGSAPMSVDLGVGAVEPVDSPDYESFAGRGVSTVLEMSLTQLAFAGEGGSDPSLALLITARARLIKVADRHVLWTGEEVKYQSPAAAFTLWTADDSDLLKAEIAKGMEALAGQIGQAVFVAPGSA